MEVPTLEESLQQLVDYINEQCGLSAYRLNNHFLTHDPIEGFVFLTEWIPKRVVSHIHQRNPDGTAIISLNYHSKQILSVVFVNDVSFADSGVLPDQDSFVSWLESHTTLHYDEQFTQTHREDRKIIYEAKVDGLNVLPKGKIEVRYNTDGQLVFYIKDGIFPRLSEIEHSDYALTNETITPFYERALKMLEIPVEKDETWKPYYILEESLISNDLQNCFNADSVNERSVYFEVNHLLTWSNAVGGHFHRKDVELLEKASVHDAEQRQPHRDHLPLTENCLIRIIQETARVIQLHFPDEPGKWMVKRIYREYQHIMSEVVPYNSNRIYNRRIKVVLNEDLHAINMVDNDIIYELLEHFEKAPEAKITPESALESLMPYVNITPVYAYNRLHEKYQIHGKLDCPMAIDAITGELIELDEILA